MPFLLSHFSNQLLCPAPKPVIIPTSFLFFFPPWGRFTGLRCRDPQPKSGATTLIWSQSFWFFTSLCEIPALKCLASQIKGISLLKLIFKDIFAKVWLYPCSENILKSARLLPSWRLLVTEMPSGGEARKQSEEMKRVEVKEKTEGKSLRLGGKTEAAVRDDKGWRDEEKTEGRGERTEERRRDMLKLSCVL